MTASANHRVGQLSISAAVARVEAYLGSPARLTEIGEAAALCRCVQDLQWGLPHAAWPSLFQALRLPTPYQPALFVGALESALRSRRMGHVGNRSAERLADGSRRTGRPQRRSYSPLGGRLRMLRDRVDLTQEQLGDVCGVSAKRVSQWELGATRPTAIMLQHMADALGADIQELAALCLEPLATSPIEHLDMGAARATARPTREPQPSLPMGFGDRFHAIRLALGLSRAELVRRTGMGLLAITRWERGHCDGKFTRRDTVPRMADALGVTIAQLLDVTGPLPEIAAAQAAAPAPPPQEERQEERQAG